MKYNKVFSCSQYFQLSSKNGTLPESGLMIKTHHVPIESLGLTSMIRAFDNSVGFRLWLIMHTGGRAVLLLRNPFEAILSWWRHIVSGSVLQVEEFDMENLMVSFNLYCFVINNDILTDF